MPSKADWQAAIGKTYRTRGGGIVTIVSVDERYMRVKTPLDYTHVYDLDGKLPGESSMDLMEVERRP